MSKVVKSAIIDHLTSSLEGVESAVVVNSSRMTVEETEILRTRLRGEGVRLLFLKNRLAAIAFEKVGLGGLDSIFADGPAAIAFGGEGAIAISKITVEHAKKVENLKILGAYLDGQVVDAAGVEELSKLPGKKELQSMVLQGLFGPVSDFARSMDGLFTEMHGLIEALGDKKEKGEG